MALRVDRLDHLVLNVRDVERAAEWYAHVLGMERRDFVASAGGERRIALYAGAQKINLRPARPIRGRGSRPVAQPRVATISASSRRGRLRTPSLILPHAACNSSAAWDCVTERWPDDINLLPGSGW